MAGRSRLVSSSALVIGGTGQIGVATARRFLTAGWNVTVASRSGADDELTELGAEVVALDRADTAALRALASGRDAVVDVVAYTAAHADQLTELKGSVGSLVVISSGAVYRGAEDGGGPLPVPVTEDWPTLADGIPDGIPAEGHLAYGANKAAMERALLAAENLPVSILRPGTLHGPRSPSLHQWSFIKPAVDRRPHVVLAYDGRSVFSTSATANVAELAYLCSVSPGTRVLNAADDEALTVAEIGGRIFALMGRACEIVTFPGPPRADGLGFNPWGVPHDIVLDMTRAREELGYTPAISYDEALRRDIEWAIETVNRSDLSGKSWQDVFPGLVGRFGAACWFPYQAEDAYLEKR
jgi:nucleoside-diphosphate-sugar epimerase